MNNNLKVISGTLAGILIGGLTVVGANQAIQAIQNTEIKVSLNGQVQEFKDETTGEVQYPITYHDRTYLPLRNVAQLVGLDVDYDVNSNLAVLTSEKTIYGSKMDNYIIEDSDSKIIDQFENLSYDQLMFAKNEIFARYGYDFSSKKIRSYFDLQNWYKPVKGKTISTEDLNTIEQENVKILDEEINRRLTWVNEGNLVKELNMPVYQESFTIDEILKANDIIVQSLSKGAYDYRISGIKVGEDTYQGYIHFEINGISEYGYRSTSNAEFYMLKDSKILLDFSSEGLFGDTSIDSVGTIYILKNYIVNVKVGANDYSMAVVFDKNGTYLFIDYGLGIDFKMTGGKLFEYVFDEPAGYMEGAIGDYNFYNSIYEFYMDEDNLFKKRVGIDYGSVLFTAQT